MNIKTQLNRHSPSILLGLGITGFVAAVILAAKSAPEAKEKLAELPPDASKMAQVKSVAPTYAPIAALVLASSGAILASNNIMRNRYAALFALYSFTDQMGTRWKEEALKQVGDKAFKQMEKNVLTPEEDIPEEVLLADGPTILFDNFSGRWFNAYTVEHVRKAINECNQIMFDEGWCYLNEFYDLVGLPRTGPGHYLGWRQEDGTIDIVLTAFERAEEPRLAISYNIEPRVES